MVRKLAAWACGVGLILAGCGSKSGLRVGETESTSDAGPTGNPLCRQGSPGQVVVLATFDSQPATLGVAGAVLFAADWAFTGSVYRLPVVGGPPVEVATNQPAVNAVATDASSVYWVTQGWGNTDGALTRSVGAGAPSALVTTLTRPQGVAVYGDYVYFTDGIGPPAKTPNGRVQRLRKGGLSPQTLVKGLGDPWAISVDASGVYFTDTALGTFNVMPHAGGAPDVLAQDLSLPYHTAADGRFAYYTTYAGSLDRSDVFRVEHGTASPEFVATDPGRINGLAADARGAVWVASQNAGEPSAGRVYSTDESGQVSLLAEGAWSPFGVAVDEDAIYFTALEQGVGSVRMLCRAPRAT